MKGNSKFVRFAGNQLPKKRNKYQMSIYGIHQGCNFYASLSFGSNFHTISSVFGTGGKIAAWKKPED